MRRLSFLSLGQRRIKLKGMRNPTPILALCKKTKLMRIFGVWTRLGIELVGDYSLLPPAINPIVCQISRRLISKPSHPKATAQQACYFVVNRSPFMTAVCEACPNFLHTDHKRCSSANCCVNQRPPTVNTK